MWAVWLIAAFVLAIAELASLDLVLLLSAGSALAAMIAAFTTSNLIVQVGVFVVVLVLLLGFLRPALMDRFRGGLVGIGIDKLIGMRTFSLGEITATNEATINLNGIRWKAQPYDPDEIIPARTGVVVLEIRRSTAYVMQLPPELQDDLALGTF